MTTTGTKALLAAALALAGAGPSLAQRADVTAPEDGALQPRPAPSAPAAPTAPSAPAAPSAPTAPPVLVILAHPDDEITIAPALARIARDGGTVKLVYATSGDAGPGSSGLTEGAAIAALREDEGRCAAYALGLGEPEFWRLGDGTLATMARAEDSAARRALARTREAIALHQPRIVMTWGPDGGYGHADHRMISALVTQVVAGMGDDRPDLLFAAFPQIESGALPQFEAWATTHPGLLTDRISYEAEDLAATNAALGCHESQFPPAARESLIGLLHARVWQGTIRFRLAFGPAG